MKSENFSAYGSRAMRNLLKSAMMELESFMATMFGCAASFAIVAGSMMVSVWAGMSYTTSGSGRRSAISANHATHSACVSLK